MPGYDCYNCEAEINADTEEALDQLAENEGWGFCWGSDGVFPDHASAMYACNECRDETLPKLTPTTCTPTQ